MFQSRFLFFPDIVVKRKVVDHKESNIFIYCMTHFSWKNLVIGLILSLKNTIFNKKQSKKWVQTFQKNFLTIKIMFFDYENYRKNVFVRFYETSKNSDFSRIRRVQKFRFFRNLLKIDKNNFSMVFMVEKHDFDG